MKYEAEVCDEFSQRMHRKRKAEFREFLLDCATENNFNAKVDKNIFAKNVVVGDPAKAKYILTAHYDTPPRLPKFFVKHMLFHSFVTFPLFAMGMLLGVPYLLTKIPEFVSHADLLLGIQYGLSALTIGYPVAHMFGFAGNANKYNSNDNSSGVLSLLNIMVQLKDQPQSIKDQFCFVFTDNEEKFLLGGFSFAHKYRKVLKDQKFINFDCVGLGNQINAYYAQKSPTPIIEELKAIGNGNFFVKPIKSSGTSMSDHIAFRKYNHTTLLCVDSEDTNSLYSQIHSANDNKISPQNIDYIAKHCTEVMLTNLAESVNAEKPAMMDAIKDFVLTQQIEKNNGLYETKMPLSSDSLKNTAVSENEIKTTTTKSL